MKSSKVGPLGPQDTYLGLSGPTISQETYFYILSEARYTALTAKNQNFCPNIHETPQYTLMYVSATIRFFLPWKGEGVFSPISVFISSWLTNDFAGCLGPASCSPNRNTPSKRSSHELDFRWFPVDQWAPGQTDLRFEFPTWNYLWQYRNFSVFLLNGNVLLAQSQTDRRTSKLNLFRKTLPFVEGTWHVFSPNIFHTVYARYFRKIVACMLVSRKRDIWTGRC